MLFDEDKTPKLKIRYSKEIKYFASQYSFAYFCHNDDKSFIGINVREQYKLGKSTLISH